MLARVRILLPFPLHVPLSCSLSAQDFAHRGYQVRILPPFRTVPATSGLDRLDPAEVQAIDEVLINGEPSIPANVFHVQFANENFDRSFGATDPPAFVLLAFDVADSFLARYRTLFRPPGLRLPLRRDETSYFVQYLNDDGSELTEDPEKCRGFGTQVHRIEATHVMVSEAWETIAALQPSFEAPLHDKLVLDAFDLLPDIGPALAVACTAVEVRISEVLNVLASRSTVPADLWTWITRKNGPPRHEELNALLKILVCRLARMTSPCRSCIAPDRGGRSS